MNTIKVKLDTGEVEIKKLPLGRYAELLKAIKELPKSIKSLEGKSNDQIFEVLPSLIGESLPDVVNLLTIATPFTKEQIEAMGLDEVVRVVVAVIEVNNYREVFENLKKVAARPATIKS